VVVVVVEGVVIERSIRLVWLERENILCLFATTK
jgi:hypothetical protein